MVQDFDRADRPVPVDGLDASDVPPLSEARDRALPSVDRGADVELDLVRPPFRRLPVDKAGGLASRPLIIYPEVPDAPRASAKPYLSPFCIQ